MQIIVKLTTNCNLNCIYCSEGDKKAVTLKKEMLFKAIDELPLLLDKINDKNITLLWHGGEPLSVGKEYLTEVMQYATEKLKNYHIKFLIQTNGNVSLQTKLMVLHLKKVFMPVVMLLQVQPQLSLLWVLERLLQREFMSSFQNSKLNSLIRT